LPNTNIKVHYEKQKVVDCSRHRFVENGAFYELWNGKTVVTKVTMHWTHESK